MPRGGSRLNAGRKPGAVTKRTRELVAELSESGDTPLQSITELRRWAMERFRRELKAENDEAATRAAVLAADLASKEAPYVHPRLASTELKGDLTINDVSAEPINEAEWSAQHSGSA